MNKASLFFFGCIIFHSWSSKVYDARCRMHCSQKRTSSELHSNIELGYGETLNIFNKARTSDSVDENFTNDENLKTSPPATGHVQSTTTILRIINRHNAINSRTHSILPLLP